MPDNSANTVEAIPELNWLVDCQRPHAEILDTTDNTVWQSTLPLTDSAYAALTLPQQFKPMGLGATVMDRHFFRRSPGAKGDGPVETREVDGLTWIHCANPPAKGPQRPFEGGPLLLAVEKHHSLVFEGGRSIKAIQSPQGATYIQVIGAPNARSIDVQPPPDISMMEGWSLLTIEFKELTLIELPTPTQAYFFRNTGSYQGPISLDQNGAG